MLIQFKFSNFRSIKEDQTLSLVASTLKESSNEVIETDLAQIRTLKIAAIYGANASGKTNVMKALFHMAMAVTSSHHHWKPDDPIPYSPFLLDPSKGTEPSTFELDLLLDGTRFRYGFSHTADAFTSEWLYAFPKGRRQLWYIRNPEGTGGFRFGKRLTGENKAIESLTRKNSLFLSAAAQNNHELLTPIYKWFSGRLAFANKENREPRLQLSINLVHEGKVKRELIEILKSADLGVVGIEVKDEDPPPQFSQLMEAISGIYKIESPSPKDPEKLRSAFRVASLIHRSDKAGHGVSLPMSAESEGTVTLFALSSSIVMALQEGRILCVDELDAGLHPSLSSEIIRMFSDPARNPKNAQLIFNTHNTNILSEKFLRRDQIWFTEKDEGGATHLYPLTDFKPRRQENLEFGYLQGRYGAIPFIGPMKLLDEETGSDHG